MIISPHSFNKNGAYICFEYWSLHFLEKVWSHMTMKTIHIPDTKSRRLSWRMSLYVSASVLEPFNRNILQYTCLYNFSVIT